MWLISLLIISFFSVNLSLSPATIAPIVFEKANINGYGVRAEVNNLSFGYYSLIHTSRLGGNLLIFDGGVSQRKIIFSDIQYSLYRKNGISFGIGINKIEERTGYEIYLEKNFSDVVRAKLMYLKSYYIEPFQQLSLNFSVNLSNVIKEI